MSVHRYTSDTSAEAEAVQLDLIRAMSPSERSGRALRLTAQMRRRARAAIRRRYPELTDEEVGIKLIELHYGAELAQGVRELLEQRKP